MVESPLEETRRHRALFIHELGRSKRLVLERIGLDLDTEASLLSFQRFRAVVRLAINTQPAQFVVKSPRTDSKDPGGPLAVGCDLS